RLAGVERGSGELERNGIAQIHVGDELLSGSGDRRQSERDCGCCGEGTHAGLRGWTSNTNTACRAKVCGVRRRSPGVAAPGTAHAAGDVVARARQMAAMVVVMRPPRVAFLGSCGE